MSVSEALLYGGNMARNLVQVRADIPGDLKRQAFSKFALQDEKFNRWLKRALEEFVQEDAALADYLRGVKVADDTDATAAK
jgi:hypothetical protein